MMPVSMHSHWLLLRNYKGITGNWFFLKPFPIYRQVPAVMEFLLNWNRRQFSLIDLQFFYPMWMCMPDTDDSMSAIHVKVFNSFIVPNVRPVCFYYINVINRINVK